MKIGLDISSIGYFVLMDNNRIIDVCQVPQKIPVNKIKLLSIQHKIKELEPNLKVKGLVTKTKNEIAILERQIKTLEDNSPRDVARVVNWLNKYIDKIDIVNIEKPLLQTNNPSKISSITKGWEYLGICTCILDSLGIEYNILSSQDWRSNFDYNKPTKEQLQEIMINKKKKRGEASRIFTKMESIRISIERVVNIKDYYIPNRCRVINDDICESAILGLI